MKEIETGLAFNDVYLESPVSEEGSDTMMDLLADDEDVEYVVTEKEKQNVLAKIIKTVTATLNWTQRVAPIHVMFFNLLERHTDKKVD